VKVWVNPPVIDGDRVAFSWTQSEPNPYQHSNSFFFRYEGIELAGIAPELLWEIFLAMQLRVFAGYKKPIELNFPTTVPAPSAQFWQTFHPAPQVTINPIAGIDSYTPWTRPAPSMPQKRAAIFYGGGKDSLLATGLLGEIYGRDQVLLIQYVAPYTLTAGAMTSHEQRQENLMLAPIREEAGVSTQRVYTDFLANLTPGNLSLRPHLQFYTAGALPVLLAYGVEMSSFGATRTDYPILPRPNGGRQYVFARSRPEVLAAQSRHYQRVLGFDHTVTNINFPFTTVQDVTLLHQRYPELFPLAVMCTRGATRERWCYRCSKCLNYALYALAAGYVDPRFDYDRLFTISPIVPRIVAYAQSGVELSHYGNAPWQQELTGIPQTHQAICHSLAVCDPDLLRGRMGQSALGNLYAYMAIFGNTRFANQEVTARDVFAFPRVPIFDRLREISAEHFPVVDRLPGPWIDGNTDAIIDFDSRMRTDLDALPHLL
jgi:hypothetical protein